ncbi:MAG: hypothetical protein I3I98_04625 [Mobilibacterium timonense]|uniref:hypothetical protein n=1 Tax=Mobilibacterium timonense TaxID=1871012 RepID=UPI002354B07D|nr:hypothetical protein [Mobilibacterium timonense]MBM6990677.1 hypothetical protein [Mobilibacterium timonense]
MNRRPRSKKKEPRYMRESSRGGEKSARIALVIFIVAAAICEAVLIWGCIRSNHKLMMGLMTGLMTAVFIGTGKSISFFAKMTGYREKLDDAEKENGAGEEVTVPPETDQ